jgi:hypothetical protein
MAKETNIKTDKKTVGGWRAWELRNNHNYLNGQRRRDTKNAVVKTAKETPATAAWKAFG